MAGIADVAKQAGTTAGVVKAVFEAVCALSVEGRVTVKGFGAFKTTHRAARNGRNPKTGAVIDVPAKDVLTFKAV